MYLDKNNKYWERGYKGYPNENIESFIFRPYGRILDENFQPGGALRSKKRMLDFGCGSGQPLCFFKDKGFDVFGVDISQKNIDRCKERMPGIQEQFSLINPSPSKSQLFFKGNFGLITAIQSLYYFSDLDLQIILQCLYDQMVDGGIIYATMIGSKSWHYKKSSKYNDGLSLFSAETRTGKIDEHYLNFTKSENDLKKKFNIFEPLHTGFHSERYRDEEGADFHYTFVGVKNKIYRSNLKK